MNMEAIMVLLICIGICVVLPVMIVWLVLRSKINADNANKEIILSVIEKNPNIDVKELLKKQHSNNLLKEKMIKKLHNGIMLCLIGLVLIIGMVWLNSRMERTYFTITPFDFFGLLGGILIAMGIASFISCNVMKRTLAREMEAEAKNLEQE